uniref:Band 7 domain-containing protein n=1 Tax=Ditylenchus dipsaci TaxID=166011 RepID=A0A915D540_9BILA
METHHSGIEEDRRRLEGKDGSEANIQNEFGICGWILTILSYILIFLTLPISACMVIKVVQEFERAVIFRLGRLLPGGAKGPGIFFVIPCIDTYRKVDLRVLSFEVPPQEILSKDSVTVAVDAVVYFRILTPPLSDKQEHSGTKTLAEMLSDREAISLQMQATLDEATEPGRVEVKDVRLPVQLQRAMAAEAEAAREARAKVIVAEGEQKASRALKEAAEFHQCREEFHYKFPFQLTCSAPSSLKLFQSQPVKPKTTTPSYSVFNRINSLIGLSLSIFFLIFLFC